MDIYSKDLLVQTLSFQSVNVYDKELLVQTLQFFIFIGA